MNFAFGTAGEILFGDGLASKVAVLAAGFGTNAFVLTGRSVERSNWLTADLTRRGLKYCCFSVPHEPTVDLVRRALGSAREGDCDVVIGLGGGSVIDAGKAVAGLLTNPGDPLDYLEIIGKGRILSRRPVPYIAVPTTAGTGSEVTKNAVLGSPENKVKVSLRSSLLFPRIALVDPSLTRSAPRRVKAFSGLDALTQVIEPFVSLRRNPVVDALCREAIGRAAVALRKVYAEVPDSQAREDLSLVSLCGGIALTNAGLGAVHGFAGPLGGLLSAPHGALCARLLPFVCEANIEASHSGNDTALLARYDEIARLLTGRQNADRRNLVPWLSELCSELSVPTLSELGLAEDLLDEIVEKARVASSMKGNPVHLSRPELKAILEKAL